MQVSSPNGIASGRGMMQLPDGFVATRSARGRAMFETETGEAFELLVTKITGEGQVAFLTSGRMPEMA